MKKYFAVVCFAVAIFSVWNWRPFDHLLEAGNSAYYQARLAYLRGNVADKQAIKKTFSDRKITMHEYSEVVFPAYLRSVHEAEFTFPEKDKMKSKEQLRNELEAILQ